MPLTILTDSDVQYLLHSLNRQDIQDIQQSLADALHYYSTSTDQLHNGCCSSYQPQRTSLRKKGGTTTLFMPASSNDGLGMKIVTLATPNEPPATSPSAASVASSMDSLSIASSASASTTTTFDQPPPSISSAQSTTPKGSLTLLDDNGTPKALINAEELTAFRTALASTMIFKKRTNVHDVTIFGAGKQAYWHARLALILRGSDIHHLNIINRSFDRAQALVESLYKPNISSAGPQLAQTKILIVTPSHNEYFRLLKSTVRGSSVIFCTTPSVEPLFPATYLTNPEGRKKGRYISCIGSYRPHMIELHPDVIRQAVSPHQGHHHHHKHARNGGAIIVDSVDACMREAGEIIQAGLKGKEVVELGELVMLKRDAEKRAKESADGMSGDGIQINTKNHHEEGDGGLKDWLERGNVIYKSVGLGLMDVVLGNELVRLSGEKGLGTRIENF